MPTKYDSARKNMVDCQIHTNKVNDIRVLSALEIVPRENFVPEKYKSVACVDSDLPIGEGRFIMEPMIFARLLEVANFTKEEKVLVVACGTGYSVAVIAQLAGEVVGLENHINCISAAQNNLKNIGIENASFVKAELNEGAARKKPFDAIFIDGSADFIPETLLAQLNDGGRVITVLADEDNSGPAFATIIKKNGKVTSKARLFQANIKKLPEFVKGQGFDF